MYNYDKNRVFFAETRIFDVCGGNIDQSSGYISSPQYPDSYGIDFTCALEITASGSHVVEVQVLDLEVEEQINGIRCFDHLTIGDPSSDPRSQILCGELGPGKLDFTVETARFSFYSDRFNAMKGFLLWYRGEI